MIKEVYMKDLLKEYNVGIADLLSIREAYLKLNELVGKYNVDLAHKEDAIEIACGDLGRKGYVDVDNAITCIDVWDRVIPVNPINTNKNPITFVGFTVGKETGYPHTFYIAPDMQMDIKGVSETVEFTLEDLSYTLSLY